VTAVLARHLGVRSPWIRLPAPLLRAGGSALGLLGRGFGFRPMFTRGDVDKLLADTVCDIRKIRTTLGFEPHYGLEEGVRRTVQWYREQQARAGEVG
jgi:sterol-4alpha-carboxylate 3-dehydrogenase (decarboxylating)